MKATKEFAAVAAKAGLRSSWTLAKRFPSIAWGIFGGLSLGAAVTLTIGGLGIVAMGGGLGVGFLLIALVGSVLCICAVRWAKIEWVQFWAARRRVPPRP